MKLFHRTDHASSIVQHGFRDGTGYYMTSSLYSGVWLSDIPLDCNEGASGNELLVIEIPEDELAEWEWVEEGKPYREFCVPAEVVNAHGPPKLISDEEAPSRWPDDPP